MKNINNDLKILEEYMKIYIQLFVYCFEPIKHVTPANPKMGTPEEIRNHLFRTDIYRLPTFDYFKKTYYDERYSLVIKRYIEPNDGEYNKHCHGIGNDDRKGKYYNLWMGMKFYIE